VQLVYLVTTAVVFDVWERQHEGCRGREQTKWTGNARCMAFHACQNQAANSKWRCRSLPAAGQRSCMGATAVFVAATLRQVGSTWLRWLLLQRSMMASVRHLIMFHCINWRLSPLCPGRQRRPWLFALCFRLSYEYFHIRISGPKFDIRISRYRLTTLGPFWG